MSTQVAARTTQTVTRTVERPPAGLVALHTMWELTAPLLSVALLSTMTFCLMTVEAYEADWGGSHVGALRAGILACVCGAVYCGCWAQSRARRLAAWYRASLRFTKTTGGPR